MKRAWWKESIIYQIYPRSFKDSNGDGIGDLGGVIEKVDYINALGIDVVWMGPIYDSPNDDNGYDIRDYYKIHSEFGDMAQFDELLEAFHQRDIKLLMDLVVNHTSDEHEWFEASRKSKDNPYRDYYIWKDPHPNGGPPNNWKSFFGGSAWEYDASTGQYYLHLFTKKQPDLNWENERVRQDIYKILRFWLEKGVDGFRMDVIPLISKRLAFEDSTHSRFNDTIKYVYSNGPRVHEYIQEMYEMVLSEYDIMTVGEGPGISPEVGLDYVHEDRNELNMIFHLDHMFLGQGEGGKFDPVSFDLGDVKRIFNQWDGVIGEKGWISIFLDNHDFSRMVSRFGNDDRYRVESAKLLLTLILTLRGTPCIYQGSEIGMCNVAFESMDDYDDVETLNFYKVQRAEGITEEQFLPLAHELSRDNARTPFQWNDQLHGGFTEGTPWINMNPNYKEINVSRDAQHPNSILHYFQSLVTFRKERPVFVYGKYEDLSLNDSTLFYFTRRGAEESYGVICNCSDEPRHVDTIKNFEIETLAISNYSNPNKEVLGPWESRIYKIT